MADPQLRQGLGFSQDAEKPHPRPSYPEWIDELGTDQSRDPDLNRYYDERRRFGPKTQEGGGTGPWGDPNQARQVALDAYQLGVQARRDQRGDDDEFRRRYGGYGTTAYAQLLWRAYRQGRASNI